jgi:SulP family sulfate permease
MSSIRQRWGYGLPDQAVALPASSPTPSERGRHPWLRHLRGDIVGGLTAAMLSIPISMGYGLLAFSALGDTFVPQAILAGLYAPVVGCIVAVLLGANTPMVYSPRSIVTFLIGALVLHNLVESDLPFLQSASGTVLLALAFLVIFLAGFFQTVFGLLRVGTLIKYVPVPVIAGFQNAAAILIFFSQLNTVLGFRQHVPVIDVPFNFGLIEWPTLIVGIVTCTLILKGALLTKKIPPTILGMLGGIATYYALVLLGLGSQLGPVIGAIPFAWPDPHYFSEFAGLLSDPQMPQIGIMLLGASLSLAFVASLDAVLCARLISSDSGNRVQSNKELIRLGLGNMAAAGFGGLANGINLGSSFANHRSGGRTALSVLVHGLAILLAILALSPLIGHMPKVVIAGMLMVVAIQLVDRWTLEIFGKLLRRQFTSARTMLLDLLVILVVTVTAVALNILIAVFIGIVVAIAFFLFRMSKSVIRRAYRCDAVYSRKTREPRQMEILSARGSKIMVLELEGPIFFGTAENLAKYIETALHESTSYVILDLKRVNEIDSTGAKIMLQVHDRLTKAGKFLLISSLEQRTQLSSMLQDVGVTSTLTHTRIFHDADRAIEWAEEHLLMSELGDTRRGAEIPFGQLDVFSHMTEVELTTLKSTLHRSTYRKGEVIFNEGDKSRELYVIAKGYASVRLRLHGAEREARLITFSPGTVFGELALLDQGARSATIEADEDLVCYVLTHANFEKLTEHNPAVAIKLLTNLGRELSGRLRGANRTIYQLAS